MTARMQQRRDTAANWTSTNPTLAAGEMGIETDTYKFKVGNGSTAWTALPYAVDIPSQAGQTGKYLTTNGTTASWGTVDSYSAPTLGSTSIASGSTNTSVAGLTLTNGNIKETLAGFAAIGSDGIAFSADSALWTRAVSTASFGAVAFGDGKWVAVPGFGNTARYSTDGVTWSSATLPASKAWSAIAYGNGRFVAVDNNPSPAYSAYSTDGITWVAGGAPSYGFFYGGPSLTYGANGFLVAGKESAGSISTDGVTWSASILPATGGVDYDGAAAYGAGKYVVLAGGNNSGPSNLTAYSSNGTTWAAGTMPSSETWISAAFGNGKFVAVAFNSNAAAYSTDGISWTASTLPASSQWSTMTFGNGKFFAISDTGITASSADGITWTSGTIISGQYYSAAFGVSTAAASLGFPGQVLSSNGTDISWTTLPIDYVAPTLGSTTITSGSNFTNVNGLTINNTTIPSSAGLVTTTASQTLTAKTLKDAIVTGTEEDVNVVAAAATGTINFNVGTASVWYYTSNATANHTLNFRYDVGTTLNSTLATGDAITLVWLNTNGATAYYPSTIQIDTTAVTPKWQGGSAPTAGNASSIDGYVFTIIKTASATYTVLASQTRFA